MVDKELLAQIGIRIYQKRREKEMPQEQLAELAELSIQTISNIENGKKALRPENLISICRVLDVTPDFILLGTLEKSKADELTRKCSSLNQRDYEIVTAVIDRLLEQYNK